MGIENGTDRFDLSFRFDHRSSIIPHSPGYSPANPVNGLAIPSPSRTIRSSNRAYVTSNGMGLCRFRSVGSVAGASSSACRHAWSAAPGDLGGRRPGPRGPRGPEDPEEEARRQEGRRRDAKDDAAWPPRPPPRGAAGRPGRRARSRSSATSPRSWSPTAWVATAATAQGVRDGKLDMSTFEKLMAGGKRGKDIVGGDPEGSTLVQMIKGEETPKMPPEQRPARVRRGGRREDRGLGQARGEARRRGLLDRPDRPSTPRPSTTSARPSSPSSRPRSATRSPSRPAESAGRRPPRSSPR